MFKFRDSRGRILGDVKLLSKSLNLLTEIITLVEVSQTLCSPCRKVTMKGDLVEGV
jgi:hypothetical protein